MALNFNPIGKKIEEILGGVVNVADKTGTAIGRGALGFGRGVVESGVNAGRTAADLPIQTAKNIFYLGKGDIEGLNRSQQNSYIGQRYGSKFAGDTSGLGNAAAFGLDVLGARGAGSLATQPLRIALGRGVASGAGIGGAYGLAQSAQQNDLSAGNIGRNIAIGAGIGAVGGAAAPIVGAAVRPTVKFATGLGEAGTVNPNANVGKRASQKRPVVRVDENPDATYQAQVGLPTYGVKKVSLVDKAARSTRSIIERQGEHGKEIAGMLRGSRDTEELYLAQLEKNLPTVRKLKGKEFENFVETTQGKAEAASPKVAKAVEEWQATHPGIRDRAVAAGLDVGDLGPKYYPHFIDYEKILKNKDSYNAALNHLVSTGQAENLPAAIKLLGHARDVSRNRKFGNLEASRIVDLPEYDKSSDSLRKYLQGSARRIAQTETFGAKDEKAMSLIAKAGEEGYDTQAIKNAYDIAVGAKRHGPDAEKITNAVRRYNTVTRLGLGAISNSAQNINTGIVTGHLRTLKSAVKLLSPKNREYVRDTGVIADAVLNDLREQAGVVGRGISKITAPGFQKVETLNRSIAATAGKDYALRLAQKGRPKDLETLRKIGVKGEIENKTLTPEQMVQASRGIVEKTQFKVDPQDLPGWASSPGGKLVAQFRTFSYNQGKFFSNEILKPMRKGNYVPLARLLAAMPVGYAIYETRRNINNRPEDENQARVATEVFSSTGGAGLVTDIFRGLVPLNGKYVPPDRRTSMAVSTFGGPTAGAAADLLGGISEAAQRKNIPEEGLDNKLAAGNNGEQYTDLTSLGRTGLRQVPIVGSRLQNTLLPYQKPDKPLQLIPGVSAAETAPAPNTKGLPDNGSLLTGANDTPEAKAAAKLKKETRKAELKTGLRLGGTAELDKAQGRIDTATAKFPDGLSDDSKKILTRHAKLNAAGREKFDANPKNTLALKVAEYEQNKLGGKLDKLQDYRARQSLARLKVTSDFSNDATALHGLSKAALKDYFAANPDQQGLFAEVQKLDKALTAAGIQDKSKFAYGLGSAPKKGSLDPYKYSVSLNAGGSAKPKVSFSSTRRVAGTAKKAPRKKAKVSIRKNVT